MWCSMSNEEINRNFKESIEKLDYSSIHNLLAKTNHSSLDPSLLHVGVFTGQIDIIAILLDNSELNRFQYQCIRCQ